MGDARERADAYLSSLGVENGWIGSLEPAERVKASIIQRTLSSYHDAQHGLESARRVLENAERAFSEASACLEAALELVGAENDCAEPVSGEMVWHKLGPLDWSSGVVFYDPR